MKWSSFWLLISLISPLVMSRLYRRTAARQALWHKFAYSTLGSPKTVIECGSVCSTDGLSQCNGFVFRQGQRQCVLLSLARPNPEFGVLAGPQEENAVYYANGREKQHIKLRWVNGPGSYSFGCV